MTSRVSQLAARRRLLVAESAVQRESLRLEAAYVGDTLQRVDRTVAAARRITRNPWVLVAGAAVLFLLRRHPVASWALRAAALAGTARRVVGALDRMAADQPAAPDGSR